MRDNFFLIICKLDSTPITDIFHVLPCNSIAPRVAGEFSNSWTSTITSPSIPKHDISMRQGTINTLVRTSTSMIGHYRKLTASNFFGLAVMPSTGMHRICNVSECCQQAHYKMFAGDVSYPPSSPWSRVGALPRMIRAFESNALTNAVLAANLFRYDARIEGE
jgi:hypothetical protein